MKPPNLTSYSNVMIRAKICHYRAKVFVCEAKLKEDLHLKEMIHYHNEMHFCSEKLKFYERIISGDWRIQNEKYARYDKNCIT